ncbi:MAG: UDP-N-acetylmuramate--L-alanine ligase [Treponema sp.]|nr:UDP-N-acetylmuramate--L-alanine ligase [Treponema sp.]
MENKKLPEDLRGIHIHFVGIKGTGMAALVEILFHNGAVITGSDVEERFYTDEIIEKLGLKALPFSEKNITDQIQYVVYSSAYKLDKNPDLIEAVKRGIPCLLYTEALGSYSSRSYSCGICGVHGKTSTTGLTGTILKELDLPGQVLAGSIINSFGNTCTYTSPLIKDQKKSEKNIFVAETCEYQRHFMSFCPQKIILTSVESDHQDYYPTYQDIRDAFVDYICKLPQGGSLIYCADDKGAVETASLAAKKRPDICLIPYGQKAILGNPEALSAKKCCNLAFGKVEKEKNNFSVKIISREENGEKEELSADFFLKVPGRHEVLDAAAALCLSWELLIQYGKNPCDYIEKIRTGLSNFSGGKRRSEIVGRAFNKNGKSVVFIDDYGHHPTAIKTTLSGYREFYRGRKIIVDFMSHTYSRTQSLLEEFASSFEGSDQIILHKIYSSARENAADFSINGRTLFERTKEHFENVSYFEEILDAKDYALSLLNQELDSEKYPDGYLFVTMGAGDNWKLGKALLEEMYD